MFDAFHPCFIWSESMAHPLDQFLARSLKDVSRSFYLTLRVLPGSIRPQIGLAYLLARATDTIADTELVAVETRLQVLRRLRERILGQATTLLNLDALVAAESVGGGPAIRSSNGPSAAERTLVTRIEEILLLLNGVSSTDQE